MTIVHLVSALLNGVTPSLKNNGIKVQVGKSLLAQNDVGNNAISPPSVTRILICAPSNCATDDLAWKIKRYSLGPNGLRGDIDIKRFGNLRSSLERGCHKKRAPYLPPSSPKDKFLEAINVDVVVAQRLREIGQDVPDPPPLGHAHAGTPDRERRWRNPDANTFAQRRRVLQKCNVVLCTLSGAGSRTFIDGITREDADGAGEFDVVIVDEACQASEPSALIPLKFNPKQVVLVGDPRQLPVTLLCQSSEAANHGRSLFERLDNNNWPVMMLKTQYRMHPAISRISSDLFYGGKVKTSECVKERGKTAVAPWHQIGKYPPFCIWNLEGKMAQSHNKGFANHQEGNFIVETLLPRFLQQYTSIRKKTDDIEIGIISFYRDQVSKRWDLCSNCAAVTLVTFCIPHFMFRRFFR